MEKRGLDRWCDRAWIKVSCLITAVVMAATLINWYTWPAEVKILAGVAALIPVHVLEEWVFPGGFHYQYNLLMKSGRPNHAPMCRLSDMYTNFLTTLMYTGFTVFSLVYGSVPAGLIMATFLFSCLELFAHTMFGVLMYSRFKSRGKTTIYGPGSITAYIGFGSLAVFSFYSLRGQSFSGGEYALCFGVLAVILFGFILLPENIIKRRDNDRYDFESAGYFEKFL